MASWCCKTARFGVGDWWLLLPFSSFPRDNWGFPPGARVRVCVCVQVPQLMCRERAEKEMGISLQKVKHSSCHTYSSVQEARAAMGVLYRRIMRFPVVFRPLVCLLCFAR